MIRIVEAEAAALDSEAVLRSVSASLDSDTPFSREMEIRAGPEVLERLRAMGDLPVGAAVITPGGGLPAAFLIHVVLQSHEEPVTPEGLRSALKNGLRRAAEWGLKTLSLPPLGTGAGNMNAEEAASIMIPLILEHFQEAGTPGEVQIVVGTEYEMDVFSRRLDLALDRAPPRVN